MLAALTGLPLGDVLRRTAALHPERPALLGEHRSLTWAELDAEVDRVAVAWEDAGIGPGVAIAFMLDKRPEVVVGFLACARVGAIFVPVNFKLQPEQVKKRFAANAQRIAKGLTAISEAEYLGLEDQYQNIMRNYGLPAEYYTRGDMGIQSGFEKFIANDVSAAELEDRVMTAQSRVMNANPEVLASLKEFYPDITNGDILAYTLDPTKGLTDIKRKVTAAEIGGAATQAGLGITGTRAGELTAAGITKAQAQQGFQTVAEVAPRGGQLAEIYKQSPYTQTTAEQEVFGLAGSTEAARQRKKLTSLETAAFSGSAGAGAIARDRAGVL